MAKPPRETKAERHKRYEESRQLCREAAERRKAENRARYAREVSNPASQQRRRDYARVYMRSFRAKRIAEGKPYQSKESQQRSQARVRQKRLVHRLELIIAGQPQNRALPRHWRKLLGIEWSLGWLTPEQAAELLRRYLNPPPPPRDPRARPRDPITGRFLG